MHTDLDIRETRPMTDEMQSIRSDLAFLKSMAADEGSLPWVVGACFFAAGVIYGLPIIAVWARAPPGRSGRG